MTLMGLPRSNNFNHDIIYHSHLPDGFWFGRAKAYVDIFSESDLYDVINLKPCALLSFFSLGHSINKAKLESDTTKIGAILKLVGVKEDLSFSSIAQEQLIYLVGSIIKLVYVTHHSYDDSPTLTKGLRFLKDKTGGFEYLDEIISHNATIELSRNQTYSYIKEFSC